MKTKCRVCGKRFMPFAEDTYLIKEQIPIARILTDSAKVLDAIDCPRCGCQCFLKIRLPLHIDEAVEERKVENEDESET